MSKLAKLIIYVIPFLVLCKVSGQESVVASGGNANGTGGNISYSIGQTITSNLINSEYNLNHGVQQPYEFSTITKSDEKLDFIKLSIFPNPTSKVIHLRYEKDIKEVFSYIIYDINGKQLLKNIINSKTTEIDLSFFKSGSYILNVSDKNSTIKSFKIIKN